MIACKIRKKLCLASAFCALVVSGVMVEPALLQAQSFENPSSAAAAEIRFQQIEKELRRLTGRVEEQDYEIRNLRSELAKVTSDIELRVKDLEQGRGVGSAPEISGNYSSNINNVGNVPVSATNNNNSENRSSPDDGSSFLYNSRKLDDGNPSHVLGTINKSQNTGVVSSNDKALKAYEYAYSLIKAREFARAENAFAAFIRDYPAHDLVANAKYWYGETFYVRGEYEKAARIFAEGYQKFPKAPKAASNLLKLGMALHGMGKDNDACIAYKQLKKEYTKSSVSVLKRADTEMKRINCN